MNPFKKIKWSIQNKLYILGRHIYSKECKHFRQAHGTEYKIVSLGWNCLPRMLSNEWKLKYRKRDGEPTLPFDLAGHQAKSVTKILKNDFADYFTNTVHLTDNARYIGEYIADFKNDKYNLLFVHDATCKNLDEFKARYNARIKNFRKLMNGNTPLLFVYNARKELSENIDTADEIQELRDLVMSQVKNKNSRFVVITPYPLHITGASIYLAKRPYENYNWWVPFHRRTYKGVMYEKGIMDFLLSETKAMVEQNKKGHN